MRRYIVSHNYMLILMKKYKVSYQENQKLKTGIFNSTQDLPDNIITIKELNKFNFDIPVFTSRISTNDLYNLFNEINIMLKSGLKILDVLEISINTYDKNSIIYRIINSMLSALQNGTPLYKALDKFKDQIGTLPISFIKLGESKGDINKSIDSLCMVLEIEYVNKNKILSKLSYPIILIIAILLMGIAMLLFVVPEFEYIFKQLDTQLPIITRILLDIKEFILKFGFIILVSFILLVIFLRIAYKYYDNFKYKIDKMLLVRIPLVSQVILVSNTYRFFLVLKVLVDSGYKLQVALVSSKIVIENYYLLGKIDTIIKSIESGKDIGQSFRLANIFDPFTIRLLVAAQHSNMIVGVLEKLELVYQDRLNQSINRFSKILEPLLIGLLGSVVLFIVLAVLLPMWEMNIILR